MVNVAEDTWLNPEYIVAIAPSIHLPGHCEIALSTDIRRNNGHVSSQIITVKGPAKEVIKRIKEAWELINVR